MKILSYSFIAIGLFIGCNTSPEPLKENRIRLEAFGSTLDVTYVGEEIIGLKEELQSFIASFNASLSTYDSTSVISRINNNQSTELDSLNFNLIMQSIYLNKITKGAFDISIAPLVELWGFGKDQPSAVDSLRVDSAKALVGLDAFYLVNSSLKKENPGVRFNYNAIAPGLAADLIADILRQKNNSNFYINVGGEIRCSGLNSDSALWLIGIEKPIDNKTDQNEAMQFIRVDNKALATSGNYRRFYEKDGKRYSHTIDPRSGYPVQHDLLSATILAPDALTADALATACMVLGRERAKYMLQSIPYIQYYFIYSDSSGAFKEEWSSGLEKYFFSR